MRSQFCFLGVCMMVTPVIIFSSACVCVQLRECLEPEVYDLFHKKLTEQALIKDPKFLWCSHVSSNHIIALSGFL